MKQHLIIGVDISKSTLDFFFRPAALALKVSNDDTGFKQWLDALAALRGSVSQLMVVMEHTGPYSYRFEAFLKTNGIDYCKLAALQIKRSVGMIRGKDDKVDAERIAEYAWLRRDILVADEAVDEQIRSLQQLLSLRAKLVRDRSGYRSRLKEMKACGICTGDDTICQIQQHIIEAFSVQIRQVESSIKLLVASSSSISQTCQLLTSIKGIGWIIALHMISCTDNFKRFKNARKFNCYAGLAPFKHQSGSSIKARSRISHLANKEAKTLLNLGAFCAIRYDQQLREYYQRRVAEGKRKMSCINIIRSKLVARMFAIVKRQTPYQPLLIAA